MLESSRSPDGGKGGEGKTGGKEGMERTLNEAVITLLRAQQDTTLQTLPYVHKNTRKLKDEHTHEKGTKNKHSHTNAQIMHTSTYRQTHTGFWVGLGKLV